MVETASVVQSMQRKQRVVSDLTLKQAIVSMQGAVASTESVASVVEAEVKKWAAARRSQQPFATVRGVPVYGRLRESTQDLARELVRQVLFDECYPEIEGEYDVKIRVHSDGDICVRPVSKRPRLASGDEVSSCRVGSRSQTTGAILGSQSRSLA